MSGLLNFKRYILFPFVLFFLTPTLSAQYRCDWNVISSGGVSITAANLQSSVSVSQTAIGFLSSPNFLSFVGFWQIDTPIVAIKEDKADEIGDINKLETKLYSAKPNIFSSHTTFSYSISKEAEVSLKIYDIAGKERATLIQARKKPGVYTLNWNGRNNKNEKLPAGIYFYKLLTPDYAATKKLLLIK